MNTRILRIIALILLSAIMLTFVACGDAGNKNQDKKTSTDTGRSSAETTADPNVITTYLEPLDPKFSELDYGGSTVTILTRNYDASELGPDAEESWYGNEMSVEELTNDPVNDAIYNRNLYVSDLLNVKIEEYGVGSEVGAKVRIAVGAGDSSYDIVADSVFDGPPLILDGMYFNLCDNGIDEYLDSTKPWWSQKWIEECSMGDRLYCITGSVAISLKRLLYCIYYNKTFGEANGIEDLYQVVQEGRWTIDYENEIVKHLYRDMNGNSIADKEDYYGMLTNNYDCNDMYWSSFDLDLFSKDEDGWFVLNVEQEKLSTAVDKVFALVHENVGTYDFNQDGMGYFENGCRMFASGQSLLATLHLRWAETEAMRNMTDEYGMIPEPKFDERQKEYYTYAHDQYSVIMIPVTAKDPAMSGAVLEAMCYESYKNVDPAYFNLALKGRYANDPETRAMLDIIVNGFVVDAAWVYGKSMGEPAAHLLRNPIMDKNKGTFGSSYAKYTRALPVGLKEMRSHMEAFDY